MNMESKKKILLVALGGNALIRKGQEGSIRQQFENLKPPIRQIAKLSREYRIIITHGNGPQVGNLLLQQECCEGVPKLPLEILVAQTQGQIGYMIESTLDNALMDLGIHSHQHLVSLISYVVVDEKDPAFQKPTKPIGPIFTEAQAAAQSYPTRKTAKGYRRVVASPKPITVVEKSEIKRLLEMDFIVICCGGGGIPVIREGRAFQGVDAVIDKDLASARLAKEVGIDVFLIATDEEGVALYYGTKNQRFLRSMTLREAARYSRDDHFPAGSMAPKVEAAVNFVRETNGRAIIGSIDNIESCVAGEKGTEIARDRDSLEKTPKKEEAA
jgi:carbamate kinase